MNRTEDRLLVARLQARDETAVHELAERYGSRIYQLALRQMKNREDAEEVTQDVLMKVYRKIGAFRGDSALSSWIYRITFNTAMSRLRTSKLPRAAQQQERNRDGEDDVRHSGAQQRNNHQGQNDQWKRQKQIHETLEHEIDLAAEIGAGYADKRSKGCPKEGRREPDP